MGLTITPVQQQEFGGIVTSGHPLRRPAASSVVCNNFRVMPGGWLRLRGGRIERAHATGAIRQFYEFARADASGGVYHLAQRDADWCQMQLGNPITVNPIETIAGGSYSPAAVCSLRDKVVFANGLGTQSGGVSKPALSSWTGTGGVRYVGLDAYCPSDTPGISWQPDTIPPKNVSTAMSSGGSLAVGVPLYYKVTAIAASGESIGSEEVAATAPITGARTVLVYWDAVDGATSYKVYRTETPGSYTGSHLLTTVSLPSPTGTAARPGYRDNGSASLSAGAPPTATGNFRCVYGRSIYVGLYNTATGHFSNGVFAGRVESPVQGFAVTGTLQVTGITNLSKVYHDSAEQGELKYVIYATTDGGASPCLVLDMEVVSNSVELGDIALDPAMEMPTENNPPRPMRTMCYANGRIYGALKSGGTGVYQVADRDLPAVVWSAAADDLMDRDFVGVPEESFPATNKKYMPNGEIPIVIAPAPNQSQVLVVTRGGTYLLSETAAGFHEWDTVSATDGIANEVTFVQTPRGPMWITQRKQLVILQPGADRLTVLSNDFPELLKYGWSSFVAADYLQNPEVLIDRYQVWMSDSKSVCFDFAIGGQAYTATYPSAYTAARTVKTANGDLYHLVADGFNIYTQERDPMMGGIPLYDDGDGGQVDFAADYIGQWLDFGDSSIRKELREVDVIGDAGVSLALQVQNKGGEFIQSDGTVVQGTPATLSWYRDLDGAEYTIPVRKTSQSTTDHAYRGKFAAAGNAFWLKMRVQMEGHRMDSGGWYTSPTGGDLYPSVYGSLMAIRFTVNASSENRP